MMLSHANVSRAMACFEHSNFFPLSLYSLLTKVKTPEAAKSASHAPKTGNESIQLQHIMLATVFQDTTSTSYSSPACNLCQEHPPGHHTEHQQINRRRSPLSTHCNYFYPLCSALAIQKASGGSGRLLLSPDRILLFLSLSAMMKASSRDWEAFSLGSQWVW